KVLREHTAEVSAALFSPDGKTLATASCDKLVLIREPDGKLRLPPLKGHKQSAIDLAYSPDGKTLVSSGGGLNNQDTGGEVKAWDLATGKELWSARGELGGIWGVAFAPDGKTVAGACQDGTIRVWDAATGKEQPPLKGHTSRVIYVAYTPNGRTLVSTS